MNYRTNLRTFLTRLAWLLPLALCLVACSTPAATPIPPTDIPPTPTAIPPTKIPPTPTQPPLITSLKMLIGTWQPLSEGGDATYLQINSDGTCRQSYSLDGLSNLPQVECTAAFEGSDLLITAVKLNGVPPCPSPTGKYEVRSTAGDQIELIATNDSCAPRIRSTQGPYQLIH